MATAHKKIFLLYPFIGLSNFSRWVVIGIYTTIQYLVNVPIYAFIGLRNLILMMFPKRATITKNVTPEINVVTNETKADKINAMLNMPDRNVATDNKYELPMLNTTESNFAEEVSKDVVIINPKDKKQIMREKRASYRAKLKDEKEKERTRKLVNDKLRQEKNSLQSDLSSGDITRTSKPVAYRYKAIDPSGKMVTGTFTGSSKLDVNAFLVNEGYDVYSIKTSSWINFLYGQSSLGIAKMSNKDLLFWLTQLHTYIKAGIPLTDAVKILSNQMGKTSSKRKVFEKIIYELTMGSSFSTALEKQGETFPSLLINMLKAAEATGELEETLEDMANYYSETEKTRKQMVSAMTYPAIITIFSLAVVTFILVYVIPQFTKVYDQAGVQMNGFTATIINASVFLKSNLTTMLLIFVSIILVLLFAYKKVKVFRKNMQVLLMHVPIIGKVIIYNEMTLFTKTFASLLKNNVLITESVEILSKITNNEVYKNIMFNTVNNISRGEKISESFKNHWAIPDVAYYMIVTGESTGELAAMMDNVSNYYQEQHRALVTNLKAFIEPIMIVSLALIVGIIIMAVIIPMFDLYSEIQA